MVRVRRSVHHSSVWEPREHCEKHHEDITPSPRRTCHKRLVCLVKHIVIQLWVVTRGVGCCMIVAANVSVEPPAITHVRQRHKHMLVASLAHIRIEVPTTRTCSCARRARHSTVRTAVGSKYLQHQHMRNPKGRGQGGTGNGELVLDHKHSLQLDGCCPRIPLETFSRGVLLGTVSHVTAVGDRWHDTPLITALVAFEL